MTQSNLKNEAIRYTLKNFHFYKNFTEIKNYYYLIVIAILFPPFFGYVVYKGFKLLGSTKGLKRFLIIPNICAIISFMIGIAFAISLVSSMLSPFSGTFQTVLTIWFCSFITNALIFAFHFINALRIRKIRMTQLAYEAESILKYEPLE